MPELSIIIPTFNRAARLRACLKALARQSQPDRDFEVIVVIDGATDDTDTMLQNFAAPFELKVIRQDNAGPAAARNRGIAVAAGRYCLFLDDDIVASPELVAAHLDAQRSGEAVVGIGQLTISLPEGAHEYCELFAESWRQHYESLNTGVASPGWEDCYSGNLSAPREKLLGCGGFATDLPRGEDVELGYRLRKAGCTISYLPGALAHQDERKGFQALLRDQQASGAADLVFFQRDREMLSAALASFCEGGWRKYLLCRVLLSMRVSPSLLVRLGQAIPSHARRRAWYGLVRKLSYWRGVQRAVPSRDMWLRLISGTSVLLFHAIGESAERAGTYLMPVNRFASRLRWIKRMGYRPIPLEELLECYRQSQFPPARSVVITFDDGYLDNFSRGWPVLRQHGMPVTIFLVSSYVGSKNHWDKAGELSGRALMGWTQVREMASQGAGFGAHTRTHAALTKVAADEAMAEISISRSEIEHELGRPVACFAYPYGLHDPHVARMVENAGYAAAFTVDPGLNSAGTPVSALHRTEIRGTDSLIRLWLALWLGNAEAVLGRKRA